MPPFELHKTILSLMVLAPVKIGYPFLTISSAVSIFFTKQVEIELTIFVLYRNNCNFQFSKQQHTETLALMVYIFAPIYHKLPFGTCMPFSPANFDTHSQHWTYLP